MAKRGTCSNCGRPDMGIYNGDGNCAACHAAGRDLEGEAKIKALVEAKDRLTGKETPRPKRERLRVDAPGRVEGRRPQAETQEKPTDVLWNEAPPEKSPEVVLVFKDQKDQELLKTVWQMAAVQRRTVEQQILWMIEQAA